MNLEQIKDEVAKEICPFCDNWAEYFTTYDKSVVQRTMEEVCKRYATECVKASLEKAANEADVECENPQAYPELQRYIVDKSSITDSKNIILL